MLKGLYAVLVTPFDADGKIDEHGLERLVEFYLERKVHGLVTLSVMGESAELSQEERFQVAQRVLSFVNDRVPVVVGVGKDDTKVACEFGHRVVALGARALLVSPPAPNLPKEAIISHYRAVAEATGAAIVVLDYPPVTGIIPVSLLKEMAEQVPQVCAVKLEEIPTPIKVGQLRAAVGDRLQVLGARAGLYCLQELQRGSDGFMTGYAYPEHLLEIFDKFQAGDLSGAFAAYARWLPLFVYTGQSEIGIALRKEMLKYRGVINCAAVRSPTRSLDDETLTELQQVLKQVGLF